MELRNLITFKKIVELGSFSKAADSMGYSQPTITSHIQAIEKHLDIKLFDRIGKKIILTEAGAQLLHYASQIIDINKQIEALTGYENIIRGNIKIGAPETLTIYRLGPILQEYRHTFSQVDITLINDSNGPLVEKLYNGEIDLAFQIGPNYEYKDFEVLHLAKESFILVANPINKLENVESNPDQLMDQCFILNAKGCIYRAVFEDYLKSKGIYPRNSIELWSIEAIKRAVIEGLGISMLPLITVKKEIEEGSLKAIDLCLCSDNVTAQLIYHKNKWLSKAVRTWIDITRIHSNNWG